MTAKDCLLMLERIHEGEHERPNWSKKADEAFEYVLMALQREIPRKPESKGEVLLCPNCTNKLSFDYWDYCPECGQRIDR